jgi:hypothetical protein
MDYAEYWPHTSAVHPSVNPACAQGRSNIQDYFIVCPSYFVHQ